MNIVKDLVSEIQSEIVKTSYKPTEKNVGIVTEVKDEVVFLEGFEEVTYGELIQFKNGISGMVIDLREDSVGAIIFGDYSTISEDDTATSTGKIVSVPVGDSFLGRIVNALGKPIDGNEKIESNVDYPVERIAKGVIYRKSVDTPVQTGIKAVDALIPIGRGQRELIIGDRGTGKSSIAIDTVINQKGQNMICVYCMIGQRQSKIASVVETFRKHNALDYTIVVAASSTDPASMQFIVPYSATAMAEYFLDKGKDVLVVYDDLSKHAWAYRQVSLILRRPSGREAYPGDIFYLHSRLLERSCKIDPKYGGGSITALPIIETLDGDVSAYIPTNVISITDGQIFLESDLFNAGTRPAINVGISVSRVGSAAQTKAMKTVAGKLKLDLAQYRELAAFAQFESDLDEKTKKFLDRGARMTILLKQKNNHPLSLSRMMALLWAGSKGYFDTLSLDKIEIIEEPYINYVELKAKKALDSIQKNHLIDDKSEKELIKATEEFIKDYGEDKK
jgi:F-type H+-transporting ATPase subunit alpha